ncbi:tRNA glutamyl-Q(34) synthetase GluQRS [Manganibacter manganicus]|uniref:tRNA glutamyl-Q(34) synthetase GluQRS n=1 Tax=Manganibacter manganicus TaxID=1873176 RepID=A0A1V8RR65_9HYPH|nr:tRNA glutamyl-Q(34) synthetase GluQRS [Pseudaminobacter manganicus]OQM75469.1 tRNA glutamyl-Q(34) synthetase GluQRS [Pseudaminobacter manganicus]
MNLLTFRFAPSPNGELHLGHAHSVLLNRKLADAFAGRMLLRMEDIDTTRCTPAFKTGILRDLAWLGVAWEGKVRRQSEHFGNYEAVLHRLIDEELVYPAFMSRGEIRAFIAESGGGGRDWPRDPDGVPLYPRADKTLSTQERKRRIAHGLPFAWRLDVDAAMQRIAAPLTWLEYDDEALSGTHRVEARPQDWGDVIVARREIPTSYHLAVVVDDALQQITHVVRGSDLYSATAVQRVLQKLLGLPEPAYFHHRLILDAEGRKLSKSAGDTGIAALRNAGVTPETVRRMAKL